MPGMVGLDTNTEVPPTSKKPGQGCILLFLLKSNSPRGNRNSCWKPLSVKPCQCSSAAEAFVRFLCSGAFITGSSRLDDLTRSPQNSSEPPVSSPESRGWSCALRASIAGPSVPGKWKKPESFGTEGLATVAHLFDFVISVLQPHGLYGRGRPAQKT